MAWFKRTPDEELIAQIRTKVVELQVLADKAQARGITVWLKGGWKPHPIKAETIRFDEAYKTKHEQF